jgi:hypothetical protein
MSEHTIFRGPKLKVEWANHHVDILKGALNDFMKTDFYRVRIEEDVEVKGRKTDPPTGLVEVEITQDLPDTIPLIIGDVVHNLRSSLDLAICEMIEGLGGTPHRHTHFPIRETREEVIRAIEEGAIKGAPSDLASLLVEIMQPYKGGNDTLYQVHDLDITDKHRMVIPAFGMFLLILTERGEKAGPNVFGQSLHITSRRGEVQKQFLLNGMKLQRDHQPVVFVFLHDMLKALPTQGFPSEDVVQILHRLAREVSDNLETLAKEYVTLRNRTRP